LAKFCPALDLTMLNIEGTGKKTIIPELI
jgi:hypothetical protein